MAQRGRGPARNAGHPGRHPHRAALSQGCPRLRQGLVYKEPANGPTPDPATRTSTRTPRHRDQPAIADLLLHADRARTRSRVTETPPGTLPNHHRPAAGRRLGDDGRAHRQGRMPRNPAAMGLGCCQGRGHPRGAGRVARDNHDEAHHAPCVGGHGTCPRQCRTQTGTPPLQPLRPRTSRAAVPAPHLVGIPGVRTHSHFLSRQGGKSAAAPHLVRLRVASRPTHGHRRPQEAQQAG